MSVGNELPTSRRWTSLVQPDATGPTSVPNDLTLQLTLRAIDWGVYRSVDTGCDGRAKSVEGPTYFLMAIDPYSLAVVHHQSYRQLRASDAGAFLTKTLRRVERSWSRYATAKDAFGQRAELATIHRVITDRSYVFSTKTFTDVCSRLGVQIVAEPEHRPAIKAAIERLHRQFGVVIERGYTERASTLRNSALGESGERHET